MSRSNFYANRSFDCLSRPPSFDLSIRLVSVKTTYASPPQGRLSAPYFLVFFSQREFIVIFDVWQFERLIVSSATAKVWSNCCSNKVYCNTAVLLHTST